MKGVLSQVDDAQAKINEIYEKFENEQIEYSVVEKLDTVIVIPANLGWSDVGNWSTLHEVLANQTGKSNVVRGEHIDFDSHNVLVYAHDKMVATVGLKDLIVVDSDDVLLIANKNRAQDIKALLDEIKNKGKHLYL